MRSTDEILRDTSAAHIQQLTEPSIVTTPMSVRGWELLNPDISHLDNVVARAAGFDINHFQISHGIMHTANALLTEPWRAQRVRRIAQRAHKEGIEVFIWTHELDDIPGELMVQGRVDLRSGDVWDFLIKRYEKVFGVVPEVDGLVLTIQETQVPICDDSKVISNDPKPRRMAQLINAMHDICARHGKKLIFRVFYYTSDEIDAICKALADVPDDVVAMAKCQLVDWAPHLPHEPLVMALADSGRAVIIEYDLGNEYHGQHEFPYVFPSYLQYRMNHFANLGVHGSVARIERYSGTGLGTINEVDFHVFSGLLQNPADSATDIALAALTDRFGQWAIPVSVILEAATDVINRTVHPNLLGFGGFLMQSAMADYHSVRDRVTNWRKIASWMDDKSIETLPERILEGDNDLVEETLAAARPSHGRRPVRVYDRVARYKDCI